ncbi:MAG TPA: DUF4302 domain-containing protein [Paludibacter sp.]|nr:DUF4302 domain-containing protein [Paludibacter sp.]
MKKISILLFSALLWSCVGNEKDIFSASPADRLNNALKDDYNVLTSSANGWVMEYFANPLSPGYNLLVKFEQSGKATFASKSELTANHEYEVDSCLFEMIGDNGPVLTFNTYNKVLHRFSNPENPDGYGLQGDYEFVVLSAEAEKVVLKGKKYGSVIVLTKFPENTTWRQFADEVAAMDSLLFSESAPKLKMTISNSGYTFSNGFNHVFSVIKNGSSAATAIDAPFIVTRTGIRFQKLVEVGGLKFQSFNLNDDKTALVSVENPDSRLVGADDLGLYFVNTTRTWELIPTELSDNLKALYGQIVQSCTEKYNAGNVKLALRYYLARKSYVLTLSFDTGLMPNAGNLDFIISNNANNSLVLVDKATGDTQGATYRAEVAGLGEMCTMLSNAFTLSTASTLNPKKIRFTQNTGTGTWFVVK